ncbi:MAG: outer membrane protein transport protein [Bernardetiaceae bacterium]|nr:outer membrane protein transport protein [Bernardetiaceae bacterium]
MRKNFLSLLMCALLSVSVAQASGYQVLLQGSRATGLGNSATGYVSAQSVFFNPGAMAMLEKSEVQLGVNFVNSKINYLAADNSTYTASTQSPVGTPFFLYGVYKINDKMAAGLAVVTPFGSTVEWEDNWLGQYALNRLSLQTFSIQPTFSYRILDNLSVGAGLNIAMGSVSLNRNLPITGQDGVRAQGTLEGTANTAIGFNLGVFYQPMDKFSIGFNYRSRVNAVIEGGDATFDVPNSVRGNFPNTTFNSELPMPSVTTLGLAFYPMGRDEETGLAKLMLTTDINYVGWSAYEELRFDYAEPVAGSTTTVSRREYKDTFTFRFGAEYRPMNELALRVGIYYDQTSVKDGFMTPESPDSNTLGYTIGAGYTIGNRFNIDAHLLIVDRAARTQEAAPEANTISGTFHAGAIVPGFALSFLF